MGLIVGRETIKSRVYYHISFELDSQLFMLRKGIENPEIALELFRNLQRKNIFPKINRTVYYDSDKNGYLTKDPDNENLTIDRLEEIVRKKEINPSLEKNIVEYTITGRRPSSVVDIGD